MTARRQRFSRASHVAYLHEMMTSANFEYRRETGRDIDPQNGTSQIPALSDRDALVRAVAAYSRWRTLRDLVREVES